MKHYRISQWVDFVRGVDAPDQLALEQHLESGCRECLRTVELLREVERLTRAEALYQPPPYAVDSVKALAVLQHPEKVHLVPALAARLVYDSFLDPLPVGVRMRHRLSRHALYRAGDYNLDLRLEHERGASSVTLVGQVARRKRPAAEFEGVPVYLVAGRRIVGQSATNRFGEFHLEYKPKGRMRLYVPVTERKRIAVRLGGLTSGEPSGEGLAKKGKGSR